MGQRRSFGEEPVVLMNSIDGTASQHFKTAEEIWRQPQRNEWCQLARIGRQKAGVIVGILHDSAHKEAAEGGTRGVVQFAKKLARSGGIKLRVASESESVVFRQCFEFRDGLIGLGSYECFQPLHSL